MLVSKFVLQNSIIEVFFIMPASTVKTRFKVRIPVHFIHSTKRKLLNILVRNLLTGFELTVQLNGFVLFDFCPRLLNEYSI